MTQSNLDPANPVVTLDFMVDRMRSKTIREEYARLLEQPGVESITLHLFAQSGMIPIACDLHEHLRDLRSTSPIPLRAVASGICGSAATLLLLAFAERRCSDGTMFTMQRPFFNRRDLDQLVSEHKALSDLHHAADRFYGLFGAALGKNPTDAELLFRQAESRRGFKPQEALDRGIVTDVLPFNYLVAA